MPWVVFLTLFYVVGSVLAVFLGCALYSVRVEGLGTTNPVQTVHCRHLFFGIIFLVPSPGGWNPRLLVWLFLGLAFGRTDPTHAMSCVVGYCMVDRKFADTQLWF